MNPKRLVAGTVLVAATLSAGAALAFCGFYVAKADTKLFNRASKVVLARHEDKTVLTMANDFQGDPKEFAIVIPVPTVLEKGQIRAGERALIEHVDAYSAPRLVEYFDTNRANVRSRGRRRLRARRWRTEPASGPPTVWESRSRPSTRSASTTS
jgi:hypothetical protein